LHIFFFLLRLFFCFSLLFSEKMLFFPPLSCSEKISFSSAIEKKPFFRPFFL